MCPGPPWEPGLDQGFGVGVPKKKGSRGHAQPPTASPVGTPVRGFTGAPATPPQGPSPLRAALSLPASHGVLSWDWHTALGHPRPGDPGLGDVGEPASEAALLGLRPARPHAQPHAWHSLMAIFSLWPLGTLTTQILALRKICHGSLARVRTLRWHRVPSGKQTLPLIFTFSSHLQ